VRSFARTWDNRLKESSHSREPLSPGSIDTPGLADLLASAEAGEQRRKMIACIVLVSRIGTPEEITKAVVFLAYDDSSYITGTEPFVDGG
jgi:NAD(P)-dependent dehydrogenase (short-subunit alcohol dehydrogenase family)